MAKFIIVDLIEPDRDVNRVAVNKDQRHLAMPVVLGKAKASWMPPEQGVPANRLQSSGGELCHLISRLADGPGPGG